MARNSKIVSIPAPIGGWNVRDPLPSMGPLFAPVLDNVFCLPSEIQVRKGWSEYATFTGNAETIFNYNPRSGSAKMYVAANNAGAVSIYDISSPGAVGAAKVTGLTEGRFKTAQCSTSGGNFLYLVNGADAPVLFDGTTWYSITTSSTPYAITNVTPSDLRDVVLHKRRLWFVEKNSLSCWYLPTDQIAGAAVEYDFAPLFKMGGYITKIDTWSLDAGEGLDDYFVVFTSTGEVAVFKGTDPANASTWSLTGIFYIGSPVGTVGYTVKYGGDLLIINRDGLAQMSKSLMSSRVNTQLQMTDKIQPQLTADTSNYANNEGWEVFLYPTENMLIVNIPVSATDSYQYVMNTISGAWSRWTGIPAKCWKFSGEKIYFGGVDYVGLAWNGQSDNGANIVAEILPAYQSFGTQSMLKRWSMGRVILAANGAVNYGSRMEIDFNLSPNQISLPIMLAPTSATYDTSVYDGSTYGGAIQITSKWVNLSGIGYWGSIHTKIETKNADIRVYSFDINVEAGGNI